MHMYVRCGVIFTQTCADSDIIAITHRDNVYRYTKYLVNMI